MGILIMGDEETPKDYWELGFWEDRFQDQEEEFEWYHNWKTLKPEMEKYGLADQRFGKILVVGCGNSNLSREMNDEGYDNITNIDFSITVIQKMKAKNAARTMQWFEMDVKDMHVFEDEDFDVVIEKGCIDCVMCAPHSTANSKLALENIARVLKPGGNFYS